MVLQKIRSFSRCSAVSGVRVATAAWLDAARGELPRAVARTVRVAAVVRSRTPLRIALKKTVHVMMNSLMIERGFCNEVCLAVHFCLRWFVVLWYDSMIGCNQLATNT